VRRAGEKVGASDEQTRKLLEVCRLRDVSIITFVNKRDREGRDLSDRPMMILKSPVSSFMFRHRKLFTDCGLVTGCRARSRAERYGSWKSAAQSSY
jgi:hypothetical protein